MSKIKDFLVNLMIFIIYQNWLILDF